MNNQLLYVVWQEPDTRTWMPVGALSKIETGFRFVYLEGARLSKTFGLFPKMSKLESIYESENIFPIFQNRLMPKSRPDFAAYFRWLGLTESRSAEPMYVLAASGGAKATDSLAMFSPPKRTSNNAFVMRFFCHGISHLLEESAVRIAMLKKGDNLFAMKDVQNPFDSSALVLRSSDPAAMVGYVPRYLAEDFGELMGLTLDAQFRVGRVNKDAPRQLRLLCEFRAAWPKAFVPFSGVEFEPIPQSYSPPLSLAAG